MANRHKYIYRTGIAAAIALVFLAVAMMALMIHAALTPKAGDIAPRYPVTEPSDICTLGSPITRETTVAEGWDENPSEIMAAIEFFAHEAGVVDGMPQKDAIKRINACLCEKLVYGESKYCRTIRGPLIQRQAVCVGYALAFQYIAQYCGIDAVYVHGYTKTTAHGWNGVYFSDGSYLEVDVTMNDTGGDFERYLLITPEKMERLHFT